MEREEIFETVRKFFYLLETVNLEAEPHDSIRSLVDILDKLALAYHSVKYKFDEVASDPPVHEAKVYAKMRDLAKSRFPSLGDYAVVNPLSIDKPKFMIADALDDLADIACDLQDVLWCLENTSEDDALWHFEFGYQSHWGRHMRYLQTYLYEISN